MVIVRLCFWFAPLGATGTVTTVATSGGQTFQITGTSMGGKVLTAKLPLPANSKIVTVNVPTTQGGMAGFNKSHLGGRLCASVPLKYSLFFSIQHRFGKPVCLCFHFLHPRPTAETFQICWSIQIRSASLTGCHFKSFSVPTTHKVL